jgi:TonB-linked SusC/RagA family outer membrane protein
MRKIAPLLVMLVLCCGLAFAQSRTVSGVVRDDKGVPIPFATVTEKGTKKAVTADGNGRFSITVASDAHLLITAAGYAAQDVTASNATTVALVRGEGQLEEVVVTAQGIRRKSKELGYSISKVNTEELTNGRSPQLAQGLSGKVSGLAIFNVNQSVDPSVKITLRGYRSLTGSNDALIVIDGLQQPPGSSTMLSLLNPSDIESISILKGGQAATLYGSEGVNGALVITTKKGQAGKTKISFNHSTNIEKLNQLAQFQDKYGSGSHYATSFGSAGYKTNYLDRMKDNWRSYENQQFGDAYDGSLRPVGRTLEDGSVYMLPYSAIKGERDRIWNTGFTTNNQVSVSGGTGLNTFFLSGEHNITHGIVPEDKSQRTGIRFAASTEAGRFRANFSAAYVQAKYDRTTFDFYNETINQAAHIPLSKLRDWRTNKFASPNAFYNDYFTNPYFRLDNDRQVYNDNNITGNLEMNFRVTNWLNIYDRVGVMNNTRQRTNTVAQFFHSDWAKTKAVVPAPYDQGDGSGITRAGTDLQGSVYDATTVENVISNDLHAQFNRDLSTNFSLRGLVGFSLYERKRRLVEVGSSSIVVPDIYNVANRRGELTGGEENVIRRKFGYYADATFGWRDKIFFHATGRYDGSSAFYKSYRDKSLYLYPTYGFDVSAILTDLVPSLKSNILSYAKLRTGWNKNGNDNLPVDYGLDLSYPNAGGFPYGNNVGITVGDVLPDANLKPEEVTSFEVGGEFQFLNSRLSLEATYYTQKSVGSVLTVKIPNSTGYSNLRLNVGSTKNWGYELDLGAKIIRGKDFNWDMNVRYSMNDNKVTSLYKGVPEFSYGAFSYAAPYAILNAPFPALKAIAYFRDTATGRVMVNAATGYPITGGPLTNFGRTTPKHILGAGTKINYKALTLTTNWEYRGGNVLYSDLGRQMTFTGSGKWTEDRAPHIFPNSAYRDVATGKVVPNTTVNIREAEYAIWVDSYRLIAENFVVPAWFIKLRDINLSYAIPTSFVTKSGIFSSANVGLYGRNLITIVDKANQFTDPEFSFTNGNGVGVSTTSQTPPVRQYGFTLNINFK